MTLECLTICIMYICSVYKVDYRGAAAPKKILHKIIPKYRVYSVFVYCLVVTLVNVSTEVVYKIPPTFKSTQK